MTQNRKVHHGQTKKVRKTRASDSRISREKKHRVFPMSLRVGSETHSHGPLSGETSGAPEKTGIPSQEAIAPAQTGISGGMQQLAVRETPAGITLKDVTAGYEKLIEKGVRPLAAFHYGDGGTAIEKLVEASRLPLEAVKVGRYWLEKNDFHYASNDRGFWAHLGYILGSMESFGLESVVAALELTVADAYLQLPRRKIFYAELQSARARLKIRNAEINIKKLKVDARRFLGMSLSPNDAQRVINWGRAPKAIETERENAEACAAAEREEQKADRESYTDEDGVEHRITKFQERKVSHGQR